MVFILGAEAIVVSNPAGKLFLFFQCKYFVRKPPTHRLIWVLNYAIMAYFYLKYGIRNHFLAPLLYHSHQLAGKEKFF